MIDPPIQVAVIGCGAQGQNHLKVIKEMNKANIINQIFEAFEKQGDQLYEGGEQVTQRQHALQTAYAAEKDGASDTLIAAAILHDYGHLVHDLPQDVVARGIDDKHEELVAALLEPYFIPAVT